MPDVPRIYRFVYSRLTDHSKHSSDHVKELNNVRPKKPFFFLKPTSSILPPKSGPVLRPRGVKLHYEVELALIMGRELRDLDERDEKAAIDAIDCVSSSPALLPHDVLMEA